MKSNVYTRSVLTFDGHDDYIDFGSSDIGGVFAEGSSAFTISGWINPHQLTDKASTYGTHNVFFARSSDIYSDNFEFGISESGNLDVYIDEKLDHVLRTLGNGELTIGQWHFFAIVFNQGQLTVYIDENEYTSFLRGSSLNKATSHVTLGATLHNNIYFTGQLANISIWNYPCSQTEIQTQRYQPLAGNEQGLVAYWILNEGEATNIPDQTGNAHYGKLCGNPKWDLAVLPYTSTQSFNEGEIQAETASSSQQNAPLTESTVLDEDSSTQTTTALAPVVAKDGDQHKERKHTGKTSANVQSMEQKEELQETINNTANSKYKILAIDGGGIRGIIPAMILAEIERRTQKPIFSLFDLIGGTSSGGILALGLTKPRLSIEPSESSPAAQYSAEQLLQIFLEYGSEIFYEPFFDKILGSIKDIFGQPKYSSQGREEILRQYFGKAPLENNLKEVFVTSYDIEQRIPVFFTNKLEKQQTKSRKFRKLCGGFTLIDAALATSATPTYFAPHRIPGSHKTNCFYTLVDGGLVANNPAHMAIIEAQISRKQKTQVLNTEDILVVSLGAGSLTSAYRYKEAKNWGLLQWGRPLLNIVFDGSSEVVAGELERLFESNKKETKNYYRFQTLLSRELEEIDNVKRDNLCQLQLIAHRLIAQKSQEIDELCSFLSN